MPSVFLYIGFMATGTLVIERLPSVLGILPSTLDRLLRALQVAGLLPIGRPGGGKKGAAHLNELAFSYVMLGLHGYLPSEGPEMARKLAALPNASIPPITEEQKVTLAEAPQPCGTLGESLAVWIRFAADELDKPAPYDFCSWMLTLRLNPLSAGIEFGVGRKRTGYLFDNDPYLRPPQPLDRLTQLSGDSLLAVARLLSDTDKHLASTTTSFLDPVRANASPESNNAGPLPQEPASIGDQPAPTGPDVSTLRNVSAKTKIFKDAPLAGLVTTE